MKKTVSHNGENIKVDFRKGGITRVELGKSENGYPNHYKGTQVFIINEKSYTVNWEAKQAKSWSKTFEFEGFKCGDSDRKMTEFIISKYGI